MNLLRFTTVTFVFCLVLAVIMFFQWGKVYILDVFALFWLGYNIVLQQRFLKELKRIPCSAGFVLINVLFVAYFLTTTENIDTPVFKSYIRIFGIIGKSIPHDAWLTFLIASLSALILAVLLELVVMFSGFKAFRQRNSF